MTAATSSLFLLTNTPNMKKKMLVNYLAVFCAFAILAADCLLKADEMPGNARTQTGGETAFAAPKKKEPFAIKSPPIVRNVTEDSAVITWSTNRPATSWVEIAPDDGSHFYFKERPKYFDAPLGRKKISTVHNVKITGLSKATKYRYRIFSREVKDGQYTQIEYGKIASSPVYKVEPMHFSTVDPSKKEIKFCMLNDIHGDAERLRTLLSHVENCDFIVLNGDMVDYAMSFDGFYKGFLSALGESTNGSIPVYYLRGNHETRGLNAQNILELFPNDSGTTYYAFSYGPAAFLAIDTGEDKPDSDIEYFDNNDFDSFRTTEAKWLERAVADADFQNAPVKIAFAHMPLGNMPDRAPWHGIEDAKTKFAPILNNRGLDLLLSGHIHRHASYEAGKNGLDMPNIANSNVEIMEVVVNANSIKVRTLDISGKVCHEYSFKPKTAK